MQFQDHILAILGIGHFRVTVSRMPRAFAHASILSTNCSSYCCHVVITFPKDPKGNLSTTYPLRIHSRYMVIMVLKLLYPPRGWTQLTSCTSWAALAMMCPRRMERQYLKFSNPCKILQVQILSLGIFGTSTYRCKLCNGANCPDDDRPQLQSNKKNEPIHHNETRHLGLDSHLINLPSLIHLTGGSSAGARG
jgi:hypothetical protein